MTKYLTGMLFRDFLLEAEGCGEHEEYQDDADISVDSIDDVDYLAERQHEGDEAGDASESHRKAVELRGFFCCESRRYRPENIEASGGQRYSARISEGMSEA